MLCTVVSVFTDPAGPGINDPAFHHQPTYSEPIIIVSRKHCICLASLQSELFADPSIDGGGKTRCYTKPWLTIYPETWQCHLQPPRHAVDSAVWQIEAGFHIASEVLIHVTTELDDYCHGISCCEFNLFQRRLCSRATAYKSLPTDLFSCWLQQYYNILVVL